MTSRVSSSRRWRREASVMAARNDLPDTLVTTDSRELLPRRDIDVVDIVVPDFLHEEIGCAALAADKHVLLEKPMATSVEGCDRLIDAADGSGKVLSIGHEFRLSNQEGFPFERGYAKPRRSSSSHRARSSSSFEQIRLTVEAVKQGRPLVSAREAKKRVVLCLAAEQAAREQREIALA